MTLISTSLNWQYPKPFIFQHTVQQGDLDFLGHVNNKSYLAWMENVAWQHAKSVGISHEKQRELNRIMAVYENCMQYLASCYLGDKLLIATWVGEQQGYCLRKRYFQIIRESDLKTVFTAQATYVCIDLTDHKPKKIPAEFIKPYQTNP
ncbi:thioesterase family protein [Thiomicrorhabdus sp. Kp2]|uniref:acyl-CoA thioesterase n=1 Tax=Thiomicrorhabdus sp. Kp2 TaxID=1123518 RepID=UPI0005946A8D|nr:acyl-CoA thioesterase [Thiomicrorhabdus sp. Kp2]